jgi:hypothetical protein
MKRTHRSLLLLNFVVTNKETDDWSYYSFQGLKRVLKRKDMIRIIQTVKTNPRAFTDTGLTYIITEDNPSVHSVQWSY